MKQNRHLALLLLFALSFGGAALAHAKPSQPPRHSADETRHPNLAAARHHLDSVSKAVRDAQKANEFDLDGHAQKAKELIDQADQELKLAIEAADKP